LKPQSAVRNPSAYDSRQEWILHFAKDDMTPQMLNSIRINKIWLSKQFATVLLLLAVKSSANAVNCAEILRAGEPTNPIEKNAESYSQESRHYLPGRPSVNWELGPGRFLLTNKINPAHLPYKSKIRSKYELQFKRFNSLSEIQKADVVKVTDILLLSQFHSGQSNSLVRLGYLRDGTPVALKTYLVSDSSEKMLIEAQSAEIIDKLGIGSRFHGIFQDKEGRWNIAMDIVPGDHQSFAPRGYCAACTPINNRTFFDLEIILNRLAQVGVRRLSDIQLYRTPEGRLMMIDPGLLATYLDASIVNSFSKNASYQRYKLLEQAPLTVGVNYLEFLRKNMPADWEVLKEDYIKTIRLGNPTQYQTYFEGHQ
jgi:hypothetical protein